MKKIIGGKVISEMDMFICTHFEFNPVTNKYILLGKPIEFVPKDDMGPDNDLESTIVINKFNSDTCDANTKLYISYLVYIDSYTNTPILMQLHTERDMSRIFTNIYDDYDIAYNIYISEFNHYMEENQEIEQESTNYLYTNFVYRIIEVDKKVKFHIYSSDVENGIDHLVEFDKPIDGDNQNSYPVYWVKSDILYGQYSIYKFNIFIDRYSQKEFINSFCNIFDSRKKAEEYVYRMESSNHEDIMNSVEEVEEVAVEVISTNSIEISSNSSSKTYIHDMEDNALIGYTYYINGEKFILKTPLLIKCKTISPISLVVEIKGRKKNGDKILISKIDCNDNPIPKHYYVDPYGKYCIVGRNQEFKQCTKKVYIVFKTKVMDEFNFGYSTKLLYTYEDIEIKNFENVFASKKEAAEYIIKNYKEEMNM